MTHIHTYIYTYRYAEVHNQHMDYIRSIEL